MNFSDLILTKGIVVKTDKPCEGKGVFIIKANGKNTIADVSGAIEKAMKMNREYREKNKC